MMTPRYDGDGRLSSSSLYIIGIYPSAEDVKWAKMTPQLLMNLHSRAMCVFCNHHLQHQTRRRRDNQTQCQPTLFLSIIIISFHSIFLWLYYEKLIMIWWQQKKKKKKNKNYLFRVRFFDVADALSLREQHLKLIDFNCPMYNSIFAVAINLIESCCNQKGERRERGKYCYVIFHLIVD